MFYYALINEEAICTDIYAIEKQINSSYMIPIESYDYYYIGKQFLEGVWIKEEEPVIAEPEPEPEPELIPEPEENKDYFYAQINEEGLCIGLSKLSGEVKAYNMIEVENLDNDFLWRKYENGQWSEEKFEPFPEPSESLDEKIKQLTELTQSQEMQSFMLLDMNLTLYEELLDMKEKLDLLIK